MTLMWTIVPVNHIFDSFEDKRPSYQEIQYQGVTMLVTPIENGMGTVVRLISPNPQDYLNPAFQPGSTVPMYQTSAKSF